MTTQAKKYYAVVFVFAYMSTVGPVSSVAVAVRDIEVTVDTLLYLDMVFRVFNLPLTNINWFIDGTPATEANSRVTIINTSTTSPPATSTLTLDPVQFPAEGGMYSVTAVNPAGMDTTAFNVTVSSKNSHTQNHPFSQDK